MNRIVALALALSVLGGVTAARPQAVEPDPAVVLLARQYIALSNVDVASTVRRMASPFAKQMELNGISADRADVLVNQAVLPLMNEHLTALLDLQARSLASILTADDLRAGIAFYKSAAGQDLAHAQPQLAELLVENTTTWVRAMLPEMRARVEQLVQAQGWTVKPSPAR